MSVLCLQCNKLTGLFCVQCCVADSASCQTMVQPHTEQARARACHLEAPPPRASKKSTLMRRWRLQWTSLWRGFATATREVSALYCCTSGNKRYILWNTIFCLSLTSPDRGVRVWWWRVVLSLYLVFYWTEMEFPSSLSSTERAFIHRLAQSLGYISKSKG